MTKSYLTLEDMTMLVDAFCATLRINDITEEFFGSRTLFSGRGLFQSYCRLGDLIAHLCPRYDGSDEEMGWILDVLANEHLSSKEKAQSLMEDPNAL